MLYDVITLGETIVDLTSAGRSASGQKLFEENAGGSASIVAATVARMGGSAAIIGKVGADAFGDFMEETMRKQNVITNGLVYDPDAFTTLCFVELDDTATPHYTFVRKPGADTRLEIGELPFEMIEKSRVLHVSGLALTHEPMRGSASVALEVARGNGIVVSLDPNYREDIWSSRDEFKARTMNALQKVDVIIMDLDEMEILTGEQGPVEGSARLLGKGPSIVLIRMGKDGTYLRTAEGDTVVPTMQVDPVDRTGSGAIFIGTFLANLVKTPRLIESSLVTLKDLVLMANAASALSIKVRGGIPSIPEAQAVHDMVMHANQ